MSCSAIKIMSYKKKSMVSVIVAILLIGSAVTLTLSPFQRASALKSGGTTTLPNRQLPGQGEQQETNTSNPIKKAPETRPLDLTANTNQGQGQGQQQSNPGQGEEHKQQGKAKGKNKHNVEEDFVPIATSGNNNVYLAWPSNKTTSYFEIMFKASTDGGKTFGSKINLSNSTGIDSERPQIAAAGNNVYVTWWERANQTSNEPVLRVSNDNGKTFGEKIMLSAK